MRGKMGGDTSMPFSRGASPPGTTLAQPTAHCNPGRWAYVLPAMDAETKWEDRHMPISVSVIVPFYNTGAKIEPTLRSLLAQDDGKMELILVDDASTDDTHGIARSTLEACDTPWRILAHARNRGVAAARNTGLDAARGRYVWFMDSDDIAGKGMAAALASAASASGGAVAFCGYDTYEENTGERQAYLTGEEPARLADAPDDLLAKCLVGAISPGIWAMLFARSFLLDTGLRFTEGCVMGEDKEFIAKSLCRTEKVGFAPGCRYTHVIHDGMSSRSFDVSLERILRSTNDNIDAHLRIADDLERYARSDAVRDTAKYWMRPKYHLKRFNIHAWGSDRAAFDQALRDPDVRAVLLSSRRYLRKEPDIFLKTLFLLLFPGLYYHYRRKNVYGFRV